MAVTSSGEEFGKKVG